jgi:putative DNA primase/helicase
MSNSCKDFLEIIYQDLDKGFVSLWDKQTKVTRFYQVGDWDALIVDAERRVNEGRDVYFGVLPYAHKVEKGRGTEQDVSAITTLFMDIDVADGTHSSGSKYPESVDKALELLQNVLEPSMIVYSGGGLHLYWLLSEPITIETDEERWEFVKPCLQDLQGVIIRWFKYKGYDADNTADLVRLLRVPGTVNFKNPESPKNVEIIFPERELQEPNNLRRYEVREIQDFINNMKEQLAGLKATDSATQDTGLLDGDVNVIVRRCTFIQHCVKEAATLKEPLWHAAIDNLALFKDSDQFIHTMSQPHPKYCQDETNEKINHAREHKTPHTCRFIRGEKIGFKGCPPGGCPVEAPIGWISRRGLAYDTIFILLEKEKLQKGDLWNDSTQNALVEIKCFSEADFHNFLHRLKEKLLVFGEKDFRKVIAEKQKQRQQRQQEVNGEILTSLSHELGYPVTMPPGYYFDEQGQIYNSVKAELVAFQPLGISSQYVNRNGETFDELVFLRQGAKANYMRILVRPHILASMNKILDLTDLGVLVDSTKSSQLVSFLTRFKKANAPNIKAIPFTSRLGWQEDGSFFPGLSTHRFIGEGGMIDETDSYNHQGTIEEWKGLAEIARQNPGARLALAASFAAPLMKLVPCRTYVVHLWGPTQGGKTAAQVLASSVWMNPEKAMVSFFATKVGLEKHLAYFTNVPVVINERQIIGDNQGLLDMLIYMLTEEQGKTRGQKHGGIRRGDKWRTVIVTSGEHPLSAQSSAGGVNTRAEPYFTQVINDTKYAAYLHGECSKTFGTAGPAFLRSILANDQRFRDSLTYWSGYLKDHKLNTAHIDFLATLATADFLSSIFLWQKDEPETLAETTRFLDTWIAALQVTEQTGELHRVRAFVEGWLVQCQRHFSETYIPGLILEPGVFGDRYGWYLPDGNVGIVPNVIQKTLTANGFNWDRVKIDFAKQGWLKTVNDRGTTSYTVTRTIPGQGTVRLVELIGFRAEEKAEQHIQPQDIEPIKFQEDGDILN